MIQKYILRNALIQIWTLRSSVTAKFSEKKKPFGYKVL